MCNILGVGVGFFFLVFALKL